ncbi:MAG: acetate kinase [Oscillospiraceae bacterium]|nr:acetate kinase [Oscillospiraceae bacterium]MBQ2792899.1 acetate kinase [Oscillospiraceae bacterium]MBQ3242553.1 acetate kinase [Oscillospiraceae bacterium]MBQ7083198.1 acetate kinase [Oscillospiraceae bacterium]MBR2636275.1 acetate kinase [Oscillospiraceae bacterium]
MKVLVINAGSSSLKYQLIDMENEAVLAKGNCERIGVDGLITHKTSDGRTVSHNTPFPTHKEAFMEVVSILTEGEGKVIDSVKEISAVGHRVLHGSEVYKTSTLVTDKVIEDIFSFSELGPLHNPPQATAMKACQEVFGKETPMVAIFDTSFHQTMPAKAYMFGVPYEYYEKYSIRRYGFHGTSHRFVSARFGQLNGTNEGTRVITCHLGNGSSIAAIKDGKVVDTSMGFTPLDGFIMGTRSGGIDPSVVTYIMNKEGLTPDQMSDLMNKKSGFLGLSGVSSDCRDLWAAANEGNERAKLTLEIAAYQIKKFIGSYAAAMGGVDAVVFTGGIGENDGGMRKMVLENMEFLGIKLDEEKNAQRGEIKISTEDSKVAVWVIPTNEELLIARDTMEIVSKL